MKRIMLILIFESGAGNLLMHEKGLFDLKIKKLFYKTNIQYGGLIILEIKQVVDFKSCLTCVHHKLYSFLEKRLRVTPACHNPRGTAGKLACQSSRLRAVIHFGVKAGGTAGGSLRSQRQRVADRSKVSFWTPSQREGQNLREG